jgi:hypothetical protein
MTDSSATLPAANTQLPLTAIGTNAEGAIVAGVMPIWSEKDGTVQLNPQSDGSVIAQRVGVDAGVAEITATFVNTIASADGSFLTVVATVTVTVEAVGGVTPDSIVTDLTIVPGQPS